MVVGGFLTTFRHELVSTVLVSVFLGGAMWPIRKVKAAYKETQDALQSISKELSEQRSNCLMTLQQQGDEQVKLLGKAVDVLQEMHTDSKLMLEHLRDQK
jgi:septal ring factor EnvC (AmiA/AmiB activator)